MKNKLPGQKRYHFLLFGSPILGVISLIASDLSIYLKIFVGIFTVVIYCLLLDIRAILLFGNRTRKELDEEFYTYNKDE
jgi:hypothetical protein